MAGVFDKNLVVILYAGMDLAPKIITGRLGAEKAEVRSAAAV